MCQGKSARYVCRENRDDGLGAVNCVDFESLIAGVGIIEKEKQSGIVEQLSWQLMDLDPETPPSCASAPMRGSGGRWFLAQSLISSRRYSLPHSTQYFRASTIPDWVPANQKIGTRGVDKLRAPSRRP